MNLQNLLVERRDRIAVVTINRPKVLNALDGQTLSELRSLFETLGDDREIGAVLLTGAGEKSFVSGADISELRDLAGNALAGREHARKGRLAMDRIANLPVPVIAAVNGYALGGGCELALACHLRVASTRAKFGLPEVTLGIIPGFAGTQRLPRLIGPGRALELILTGKVVSAEEALAIGLVNAVAEPDELMETSLALATQIASRGPLAIRLALEVVRTGMDLPFDAACDAESDRFGLLCGTEDVREGMTAFLEKRPARFGGR